MTRTLPGGMATDLAAAAVSLHFAVDLQFDDTDGTRYNEAGYTGDRAIRLWTGYGDKTIDGDTYTGAGSLLAIDLPSEVSDLSAQGATVTVSGAVTALISLALSEPYVGRRARVFLGTDSGDVEIFAGVMDQMNPRDDGQNATISLALESLNVLLQRPNVRRYTQASHQTRHPSDTFFDFVTALPDRQVPWGRKA